MITIGDNTTLTDVKVLAHDASTNKQLGYTKMGKVTIGSNCFIGAKSLILPVVTIGDNVIIGAGSVVTKDIPQNSVAVGNPCHVVKSYDDYVASKEKDDRIQYHLQSTSKAIRTRKISINGKYEWNMVYKIKEKSVYGI